MLTEGLAFGFKTDPHIRQVVGRSRSGERALERPSSPGQCARTQIGRAGESLSLRPTKDDAVTRREPSDCADAGRAAARSCDLLPIAAGGGRHGPSRERSRRRALERGVRVRRVSEHRPVLACSSRAPPRATLPTTTDRGACAARSSRSVSKPRPCLPCSHGGIGEPRAAREFSRQRLDRDDPLARDAADRTFRGSSAAHGAARVAVSARRCGPGEDQRPLSARGRQRSDVDGFDRTCDRDARPRRRSAYHHVTRDVATGVHGGETRRRAGRAVYDPLDTAARARVGELAARAGPDPRAPVDVVSVGP